MQHGGRVSKLYPIDVQRLRGIEIHRRIFNDISFTLTSCCNTHQQKRQPDYSFHLETLICGFNLRITFQIGDIR